MCSGESVRFDWISRTAVSRQLCRARSVQTFPSGENRVVDFFVICWGTKGRGATFRSHCCSAAPVQPMCHPEAELPMHNYRQRGRVYPAAVVAPAAGTVPLGLRVRVAGVE